MIVDKVACPKKVVKKWDTLKLHFYFVLLAKLLIIKILITKDIYLKKTAHYTNLKIVFRKSCCYLQNIDSCTLLHQNYFKNLIYLII